MHRQTFSFIQFLNFCEFIERENFHVEIKEEREFLCRLHWAGIPYIALVHPVTMKETVRRP